MGFVSAFDEPKEGPFWRFPFLPDPVEAKRIYFRHPKDRNTICTVEQRDEAGRPFMTYLFVHEWDEDGDPVVVWQLDGYPHLGSGPWHSERITAYVPHAAVPAPVKVGRRADDECPSCGGRLTWKGSILDGCLACPDCEA